jgi:carbamoyltransferase
MGVGKGTPNPRSVLIVSLEESHLTRHNDPWVLGISASHNGAVCLLRGDELVVAIQEERLSRRKRDRISGAQHSQALDYCFDYAGIQPRDLSMVALCVQGRVTDANQDLSLNPCLQIKEHAIPTLIISHHLAHATSAFATSGFSDSAILVIDGAGSPGEDLSDEERKVIINPMEDNWEIISLYSGSDAMITPLEKHVGEYAERGNGVTPNRNCMPQFRSLGGLFSATAMQIFGEYMEAGKVMGLAPYGRPTHPPQDFFEIVDGRFVFSDKIPSLFQYDERWPANQSEYEDLACSAQEALEVALLYLVDHLYDLYPSLSLCYAGGVALNSIANERIIRESKFKNVYIIPAAEDSGPAIGAAYMGLWQLSRINRRRRLLHDAVGRQYSMTAIRQAILETPAVEIVESDNVVSDAAQLLVDGKILGWFQGRSELGPRALGQRSILCDPRRPDGKALLNSRVKHREAFRPFAPAILLEHARDWFELEGINPESAHMLRICAFKENKKALVPAVVHVDGTGRFQTVTKEANGKFYDLIEEFYGRTGVPIILNTSFNVMGLPIVESPEDALMCLLSTGIDYCVLEDVIVKKRDQILLGLDLAPNYQPPQMRSNERLDPLPSRKSRRPLKEYVGTYSSPVGTLKIDRERNQLIGTYNAQPTPLVRLADDLFEPAGDNFKGFKLTFIPDNQGFIERVVIHIGESEEAVLTRKARPWSVSKSYLKRCVGEYEVAGRRLQVSLLEEDRFLITGPGQPYYLLTPSQKDKFDLKNTPGYHLQFITDEKGKVTEAIISQPNGAFRLKRVTKSK